MDDIQRLLQIQEQSIVKMQGLITELTATLEQEHKYNAEKELIDFEHIVEDVRLTLNEDIVKSGTIVHTDLQVL